MTSPKDVAADFRTKVLENNWDSMQSGGPIVVFTNAGPFVFDAIAYKWLVDL